MGGRGVFLFIARVNASGTPPAILVFADYYRPGFRAGGPVRTLANIVDRLGAEFRFRVVTRDRDLGEEAPYDGVPAGRWIADGPAEVLYLSPSQLSWRGLFRVLRRESYDAVYLNSIFSRAFTLRVLAWRRLGVRRDVPVLLAPRGELSPGALGLGLAKKYAYLRTARLLGLFRNVTWQASSAHEAADIQRELLALGFAAPRVEVVADLPPEAPRVRAKVPKTAGVLKLVFLARVSRMKNLLGAIDALQGMQGTVSFDIYGPMEDPSYWAECQASIARLPPGVRVTYHGSLPPERVVETLQSHDVLLQPSLGENYGHSMVEALANGCPIVTSDRTPWRQLASTRAGVDVPLDRPDALRAALEHFRDMDAQEFAGWVEGARAYAARVIADDESTGEMHRLLLKVAKGMQAGSP